MTRVSIYKAILRVLGSVSFAVSLYLAISSGITPLAVLLAALASASGWLNFRLPPTSRVNLSPIVVFFALLLTNPFVAPAIAAIAAISYSIVFLKLRISESLEIVWEETVPAFIAAVVFTSAPARFGQIDSYALSILAYMTIRLTIAVVNAKFVENVSPTRFISSSAWKLGVNLVFFALVAYVIEVYLYNQFGFLSLALATIALAEFYHPWKLLSEQEDVLFASLGMVAQAIDIKDPYTAKHSRNVADLAVRLSRAMGLAEEEVRKIRIGALMHDIGKVGVSGSIIRKPMKLSPSEDSLMRQHPVLSADIMQPIELLEEASEIVRHHHEHYDGSGYPDGRKAEEIPLGSRVILVADAFDAMTTDRPYRRGRSSSEALHVLKEHAGRQFDPLVVRSLQKVLGVS